MSLAIDPTAIDPDALARQIVVRHREAGHIRFALPAVICSAAPSSAIQTALHAQAGVYRVALSAGDGKLSVCYDEHVCSVREVARALFSALQRLPAEPEATPDLSLVPASERLSNVVEMLEARAGKMLDRLMRRMSHTRQLRGLQTRVQPVLESALTEKAITNFLNDLLAFYLIRVHWDLITQRWLREPLKFRNAWLTVFYLVFLLVRYRKAMPRK
ncbi:MAG: hypothetical protein HY777_15450 [Betaproteobacteria bacterium]|nr:hypothetical protein [Betaproteobacteria bacterium]